MVHKIKVSRLNMMLELAIMLVCVGFLIMSIWQRAGKVDMLLAVTALLLSLVVLALTVPVRLWIEEGSIFKSSLLGKKELPLKDIVEVSNISSRGRYIFLLMTAERMMMLSSIPEGFAKLRKHMCEQMPEKTVKEFMQVDDAALAVKAKNMTILLAALLVLAVAGNVYMGFR